jgi:hypothetical protein
MATSIRQDYSHIAIIGNGFDLNLGLKTSYSDFVNSKEFKSILNTGNYLSDYLEGKHNLQKWIDVENELKLYSNSQYTMEAAKQFKTDFSAVSKTLKNYLETLSYDNLNKSAYSYKLLESIKNEDFLLLDFNYTKTTKTILTEIGISQNEIDERLIKIHGSVEDGEIIFGVEDHAKIIPEHVFLKKAYNQNFKAINVIDNLENLKELYIIGHSLGETDHMYFDKFFSTYSYAHYNGKGKKITLYHYGEDGYNELFMQLDNLTGHHLSLFKRNNDFKTIDTSK